MADDETYKWNCSIPSQNEIKLQKNKTRLIKKKASHEFIKSSSLNLIELVKIILKPLNLARKNFILQKG